MPTLNSATLNPADARCTAHRGIVDPPPCNGCRLERKRIEQQAQRAAERFARERDAAIRDCPDCEGTHFVLGADKKPTRRKCGHVRSVSA